MDRKDTVGYFDEIAAQWEATRQGFYTDRVREAVAQAACVGAGQRVLDLGAGSGFLASELLRRGAQVVAADASIAMLRELRRRLPSTPGLSTHFVERDRLAIEAGSMDAVVAAMYLHHVDDPALSLKEAVRVLAPGGRLAFADLSRHDPLVFELDHHDRWPGFEPAELRDWLVRAGLDEVRVEPLANECCSTTAAGDPIRIPILLFQGRKPAARAGIK